MDATESSNSRAQIELLNFFPQKNVLAKISFFFMKSAEIGFQVFNNSYEITERTSFGGKCYFARKDQLTVSDPSSDELYLESGYQDTR